MRESSSVNRIILGQSVRRSVFGSDGLWPVKECRLHHASGGRLNLHLLLPGAPWLRRFRRSPRPFLLLRQHILAPSDYLGSHARDCLFAELPLLVGNLLLEIGPALA